ncbi:hypothetical protein T440DRAFT_543248 [Plenodomus tracheiphilus IPT5]|uniref:C2H2-type domain-containing protein n=1 Tax=Plenodomus tracheiphilus IPT5 TaxID=1408161 RepID=A0A6A7ARE4_9PLEO|nr:hypothetical protein T440DRAFT_543248 [Plenodomus tracheiphilus IPT5]
MNSDATPDFSSMQVPVTNYNTVEHIRPNSDQHDASMDMPTPHSYPVFTGDNIGSRDGSFENYHHRTLNLGEALDSILGTGYLIVSPYFRMTDPPADDFGASHHHTASHLQLSFSPNLDLHARIPTQSIIKTYDDNSISMTISTPFSLPTLPPTEADPRVMIGYLYGTPDLKTIVFKCSMPNCTSKTFNRCSDLTRHYNGAHTSGGKVFWCDVYACERSALDGGRPFRRKDKLKDQKRQAHGILAVK